MKTNDTQLDCLTIDKDIIDLHCDWDIKAILQYIRYRLNLKEIEWTFSQANIAKTLNINARYISRVFEVLIAMKVLKFEGVRITETKLQTKLYSINKEEYNNLLNVVKVTPYRDMVTTLHGQGDSVNVVMASNRTNIIEKKDSKNKDLEQRGNPELSIISESKETVAVTSKEKNPIISDWAKSLQEELKDKTITSYKSYSENIQSRYN